MQALRALKGLLWLIAIHQFVVGALLLVTPELARMVVGWSGADMPLSDQFVFILKPLGAYMLMTGVIASGAARAQVPHPSIVSALAILLGLHVLYRVANFQLVQTTFGIPQGLLVAQILILSALALALTFLSRAAMRATGAVAGDAA